MFYMCFNQVDAEKKKPFSMTFPCFMICSDNAVLAWCLSALYCDASPTSIQCPTQVRTAREEKKRVQTGVVDETTSPESRPRLRRGTTKSKTETELNVKVEVEEIFLGDSHTHTKKKSQQLWSRLVLATNAMLYAMLCPAQPRLRQDQGKMFRVYIKTLTMRSRDQDRREYYNTSTNLFI